MIVPRSQLLVWVAVTVLPFSVAGVAAPWEAPLSWTLILALCVVALYDAVLAYGGLDDISVAFPEVVRLNKDREGMIELRVTQERVKERRLRLGLALPRELFSPRDDLLAILPKGSRSSRFLWPCTPLKRGRYPIDKCYVEGRSPIGFWVLRTIKNAHTEIRVYPNLSEERKNLAALFLNRGSFGIHAQRQVGKGREFDKLREYIPGDSYDEIHWKATAKRKRPITKVFQIERTQEVYVVIDASRLSARPMGPVSGNNTPTMLDRFITAGLVMGLAAEKQGDLFGFMTFNDQVHHFVRANNGKAHYNACRDALYTVQPKMVNPDFDELCTFIRLRLRRRALLMFLTNLDDPILAESFVRNMDLVCRQHLAVVTMLNSAGVKPLFSGQDVSSLDHIYQRLGGHTLWHNLRELEKVLHRRGVGFSLPENEKMCVELVSRYINIKQRQIL